MGCRLRPIARAALASVVHRLLVPALFAVLVSACSFDYGPMDEDEESRPDLIMDGVEYVRVRDGEPLVRVQAERVQRYEQSQSMRVDQFRFEQYARDGKKVEAAGAAGSALVQLESGDTELSGGVQIVVESEDLVIETDALTWRDEDRLLVGKSDGDVLLKRSDGAVLSGEGFRSEARRHSWEFSGPVSGTYIDDKDDKEAEDAEKSASGETPALGEDTVAAEDASASASAPETAPSDAESEP